MSSNKIHEFALPNGTPAAPLTWAHGRKAFSNKYQKLVPQPEYLPRDHMEARELAQLAKWLPSNISIPAGTDKEQRDQLKAAIPLWFPGGLKKKGADGGDSCRRRAVNMAPTKLVVFDLDECSPEAYNVLTMAVLNGYSAISYTTPSDTPEARRVRLVIELDRHVLSGKDGKGLASSLVMQELMESCNAEPVAEERGVWLLAGKRVAFDMSVHDAEQYLIRPHKESEVNLYHGDPVSLDKLATTQWQPEVAAWGITGKKDSSEKDAREYSPEEWDKLASGAKDLVSLAGERGWVQVNDSTINIICPNCNAHSNPNEPATGGTVIKLPSGSNPEPRFVCSHSHCRDLSRNQALAFILMRAPGECVPEINKVLSADDIHAIATGITREQADYASNGMDYLREWQRQGGVNGELTIRQIKDRRKSLEMDDDYLKSLLSDAADFTYDGPSFDEYGHEIEPEMTPDEMEQKPDDYHDEPEGEDDTPRLTGLSAIVAASKANVEPPAWVIDQLVPTRSVGFIYGASGTKKTFVALHAALCVAQGVHFLGLGVRPGHVFYFSPEDFDGVAERYAGWREKYNSGKVLESFHLTHHRLPLEDHDKMRTLAAGWVHSNPDDQIGLIIVDTLSSNNAGAKSEMNENDNNQMAKVMAGGELLARALNCAVVILHHTGKPNPNDKFEKTSIPDPRGASALKNNAGFAIYMKAVSRSHDVSLHVKKAKGVAALPPRRLKTESVRLPERIVEAKRKAVQDLVPVPESVSSNPNAWQRSDSAFTLAIINEVYPMETATAAEPEESPTMQLAKFITGLLSTHGKDGRMLKSELRNMAKETRPEVFTDKSTKDNGGKRDRSGTNNFNNAYSTALREALISEGAGDLVIIGAAAARLKPIREEKPLPTDWNFTDENQGDEEDF